MAVGRRTSHHWDLWTLWAWLLVLGFCIAVWVLVGLTLAWFE